MDYTVLPESAKKYILESQEELKELIYQLCGICAPSNHEEKRAAFCKDWLVRQGATGVYIDEAQNVIFPFGDCSKDLVIFAAHTDTVFPDTEPMPLRVEGNKAYCPGIGDDTANVATLLMLAKYFMHSGLTPRCGILFAANSGEEGLGNLRGARALVKAFGPRLRAFIGVDGDYERIVNNATGSTRYKITIKTEGGHSYGDFGNANAIERASALVQQLYGIPVPHGAIRTTYNVGGIQGGTSVNTIAQQCELLYEYRSDSRACLDVMEKAFNEKVGMLRSDKTAVEVEIVGQRPCNGDFDKAKEQELVDRLSGIITQVTGKEPSTDTSSTDCNIALSQGIPAICFGTHIAHGAHTREEYLELDSLPIGIEILMKLMLSYF